MLPPAQVRNFNEEGYMVVPGFFSPEQLALMRRECDNGIEDMHRRMDAASTDVIHISHRGFRYFINHQTDRSPALHELAFSDQMAELCRATIGDQAYFFLDQYVVKCAEQGMSFAWHQDAGYITHTKVKPYLTCWIPLDDCTVANGTIFILPFSRMGHRDVIKHVRDGATNDMVGYAGDDPGIAIETEAGTLVAFSSHLLHRSTPNTTDRMRRAYLLQYSPEPIYGPDGAPLNKVEPFLRSDVDFAVLFESALPEGHHGP
jgi:ectoine hydroxylase-related dioxygenase (phytanoyl-CoA dioxygenase family)